MFCALIHCARVKFKTELDLEICTFHTIIFCDVYILLNYVMQLNHKMHFDSNDYVFRGSSQLLRRLKTLKRLVCITETHTTSNSICKSSKFAHTQISVTGY
jgi:hypothetical protein